MGTTSGLRTPGKRTPKAGSSAVKFFQSDTSEKVLPGSAHSSLMASGPLGRLMGDPIMSSTASSTAFRGTGDFQDFSKPLAVVKDSPGVKRNRLSCLGSSMS